MYTIQEVANRVDRNNTVRPILEVANKMVTMVKDLEWVPANAVDHHIVTLRSSLPAAGYSRYNQGVLKSDTRTVAIKEKLAKLEVSTEIEKKLLNSVKNPEMFRFQNVLGCKQGLLHTFEDKLFYEQVATEQDGFDGFWARYTDSTSAAANQIVDGGDNEAGKQTHIMIVKTGEGGCRIVYPDNGTAGIRHIPHPERAKTYTDDDGNERVMYMLDDDIEANIGLAIEDWRSVANIVNVNIEKVHLPSDDADYQALFPLLHDGVSKLSRSLATGGMYIYMSEKLTSALGKQNRYDVKDGGQLSYDVVDGRPVTKFMGIPIRISDSILTNMNALSL